MPSPLTFRVGAFALVCSIGLAACSSSPAKPAPSSSHQKASSTQVPLRSTSSTTSSPSGGGNAATPEPLIFDSATKHASIYLNEAQGGGFNFDGAANGAMVITVPVGWTVSITCHNAGTIPHSCAVVEGASSATPAFSGAETPDPVVGMGPGATQSFSFSASTPGNYRIACLVPGHEDAGMWASFIVSAKASSPSISG
jgi:FtsP/CotA-like multicopper oxidase with cupredoxin domain